MRAVADRKSPMSRVQSLPTQLRIDFGDLSRCQRPSRILVIDFGLWTFHCASVVRTNPFISAAATLPGRVHCEAQRERQRHSVQPRSKCSREIGELTHDELLSVDSYSRRDEQGFSRTRREVHQEIEGLVLPLHVHTIRTQLRYQARQDRKSVV